MNWISDFVDLSGLDIDRLIHRFTLSTAEVEEVMHKGGDVSGVVVGKILSVENHPNSKKLHLLKVDAGDGVYDCVCGAPNVRAGMLVPFAKIGGKAGGMDIQKAAIAGFDSYGMCCSERELGLSAEHSGLMEIFEKAKPGTDIKKLYQIDDIVFEVDNKSLTNRPDLWGHYGIAREFAALAGRKLKPIPRDDLAVYADLPEVEINVHDPLCLRYSSVKVDRVTVRKSPANMRIRLFYCGMRGINLLADITNYIMLELGQPMHAFDLRRVDKIDVRRFAKPFQFETLDKTVRTIDEDTLMICSGKTPVAIAGIMGGFDSEIADDTDSLLLESATFDGVSVRKSGARLGLRTDASMRYEKMLDPELTIPALERYVYLLRKIDKGVRVISRLSDSYVKRYDPVTLEFDKKYVDRYTGINISSAQIIKTLKSLGFTVRSAGGSFSVDVPSWRVTKDVTIKADIIEEITRIYGYDNFEIQSTVSKLAPVRSSRNRVDDTKIKGLLCDAFHLHEVHSYLWCDAKKLTEIGIGLEPNPRLVNSISPDSLLRRSLIPTQLIMLTDNKSFDDEYGIFEIGRVVDGLDQAGLCSERKKLGITLFSRQRSEKELYLYLKDMIFALGFTGKNVSFNFAGVEKTDHAWQHPVNSTVVKHDGKTVGAFYALDPAVGLKIDKKAAVVCAEIDMDIFYSIDPTSVSYAEPSKFPGIEADLSLLLNKARPYSDISSIVNNFDSDTLSGFELIDIYENDAFGDHHVVTVRLSFSSPDRTLSSSEVQSQVASLINLLKNDNITLKM